MTDPEPPEPSEHDKWINRHRTEIDTSEHNFEDYEAPDWITPLDREICSLLNYGITLTPSLIAKNIDRPRSSVSRRLNTLEAGGIVAKEERGHYKLTSEGWAKMNEKVMSKYEEKSHAPDGYYSIKVPSASEVEKMEQDE